MIICTLNRPEKLNALSTETFDRLGEALLRLRDTDALKVMLIKANGRYFSAGVDQKEGTGADGEPQIMTARGIREQTRLQRNMQGILDEMEHVEKPSSFRTTPCAWAADWNFRYPGFSVLPERAAGNLGKASN